MKPIFFTLPPSRSIEYPYLFVTFFKRKELLKRRFKQAIMDSNVGLFFYHRALEDYPSGFLDLYTAYAKKFTELFGDKLFATIPDLPADYFKDGKQTPSAKDNVERTLANIRRFIKIEGVNWLPVIQSRYLDTFSFIESCVRVKEIIGDYPRVAIGTVCKSRDLKWIIYCCRYARSFFPKQWIHAFGLTLNALPHVKQYIDSWDSMAWTFPRTPWLSSCKNKLQAEEYFKAYIRKVEEKLSEEKAL
jgi:hypothetical protein